MTLKITVIGAGPGGYAAAIRAAQLGAEVTVIEGDNVGGTCLNRGCIPSKIMRTSAGIMESFKKAGELGITIKGEFFPDMKRLLDRKHEVIRNQAKGMLNLLEKNKITFLKGRGHIKEPGLALVDSADGTSIEVAWDKLILALGSQPVGLPSFPFDGDKIISSSHALSLDKVPESFLIVGGGVIGCEFASIFSCLGAKVTLVESMPRLLPVPSIDVDCSKILQREMKKRKIRFMINCTLRDIDVAGEKVRVTIGPSSVNSEQKAKRKKTEIVEAEKILVCTGRKPEPLAAGFKCLNLKIDQNGWLVVNSTLQSSNPDVYAVGDMLGPQKIMLAHVASTEGLVAAENAMGKSRIMDYNVVPGAIFTAPEIADVGLTEAQAMIQGINAKSDSVLFRTLGKAHATGEIAGHAKIVSDKESGKILGVHIVGAHATDLIAEGALAIRLGCSVRELAETIHAHPTFSEVMSETAMMALGR